MKILFISDNPILGCGGGSIENKKHYEALKNYCSASGDELKVISRDDRLVEAFDISILKNKRIDILSRILGHSTYLFYIWNKNYSKIKKYNPDILYLGRSRFGFMAKDLKKDLPKCKVITNIDNVELDYVDSYFALKKGIRNILYRFIEYLCVYRDEKNAVYYSDYLLYLTQRNVIRIREVYKYIDYNPIIIPICLESELNLTLTSLKRTIVFIGSLDYAANIMAVLKILKLWKDVYTENDRVELLIAGRNPDNQIESCIQKLNNVRLVKNFNNITEIIPLYSLMLAPIDKGAGMKVKVAETLSMGLLIAASDEALIGYEEALSECTDGIIRANSLSDFQKAIDSYLGMDEGYLQQLSYKNKELYKKYYSYQRSESSIQNLLNIIIQKGE